MINEAKPTPGPYRIKEYAGYGPGIISESKGVYVAKCVVNVNYFVDKQFIGNPNAEEEAMENAKLMLEALNVLQETGYTPRQLVGLCFRHSREINELKKTPHSFIKNEE